MNMLYNLRKSFSDLISPEKNQLLKALYQWKLYGGVATPIEDDPTAYLTKGYAGNADVYSIINRQLRMSSQARLGLFTKDKAGKWVEVTDHELCSFLRQVNPVTQTSDFIEGHIIYKQSIGNSFWYKPSLNAGVNAGKTKELWLMPGNNVRILGGDSWMNPIGGYELETNTTVHFEANEVYHSKFFNPLFGEDSSLYGQSPLKAAARIVAKQNEAELTELKQFTNQGPSFLLSKKNATGDQFGSGLTDPQREELQNIITKNSGSMKAGHPLVLPDEFTLIRMGVSPVDLNILNSSVEGRRVLCNIYGMAAGLFNDTTNLSYNNMMEMEKGSWNNCMKPLLDTTARELTACLINSVPEYVKAGLFFGFDYSEVAAMQKDRAAMVTWMKQAYWTPNEIRDATGAKPYPEKTMDEPWVGISEQPISSANAPLPDLVPSKGISEQKDYK